MSHTVTVSGVVRTESVLRQACAALNLPAPQWQENYQVAAGTPATGFAVQLPGWAKLAVFNVETGEVAFDNWPVYGPDHYMVKSGEKRVGDGGRWGDIAEMDKFNAKCDEITDNNLASSFMDKANDLGEQVEYNRLEDGSIELLILHA